MEPVLPCRLPHKLHAAVRAAVVEHADLAVHAAHHDHRLAADLHGDVVAGLFDLRLVAAIDPGLLPDVLHLPIEYLLIGVDGLMDAVGFDQSFESLHATPLAIGGY